MDADDLLLYSKTMLVGILSDTHGSVSNTLRAARLLLQRKVGVVFHCGDIGSEQVLIELAGLFGPAGIPMYAVLGNVDLYLDSLEQFPASTGIHVLGRWGEQVIDDRRIGLMHGDDSRLMRQVLRDARVDYLLCGHTHTAEDRREGSVRIINPGAVYRTSAPSVAVLDSSADTVEWIGLAAGRT